MKEEVTGETTSVGDNNSKTALKVKCEQ